MDKSDEMNCEWWSYPTMNNIRQFYMAYSKRIDDVYPISDKKAKQCLSDCQTNNFQEYIDSVVKKGNAVASIRSIRPTKPSCKGN